MTQWEGKSHKNAEKIILLKLVPWQKYVATYDKYYQYNFTINN